MPAYSVGASYTFNLRYPKTSTMKGKDDICASFYGKASLLFSLVVD